MSGNPKVNGVSRHWLADHANLRQTLQEMDAAIDRQAMGAAAIADRVAEAADRVLAQFRQEEDGGHLGQAVDAAPHLAVQAHGLLDEHEDLAARLNELRRHAAAAIGSAEWWKKLGELFEQFLVRFEAHEEAENRLLQMAYNEDIAAED
jgi:hypothetical protein